MGPDSRAPFSILYSWDIYQHINGINTNPEKMKAIQRYLCPTPGPKCTLRQPYLDFFNKAKSSLQSLKVLAPNAGYEKKGQVIPVTPKSRTVYQFEPKTLKEILGTAIENLSKVCPSSRKQAIKELTYQLGSLPMTKNVKPVNFSTEDEAIAAQEKCERDRLCMVVNEPEKVYRPNPCSDMIRTLGETVTESALYSEIPLAKLGEIPMADDKNVPLTHPCDNPADDLCFTVLDVESIRGDMLFHQYTYIFTATAKDKMRRAGTTSYYYNNIPKANVEKISLGATEVKSCEEPEASLNNRYVLLQEANYEKTANPLVYFDRETAIERPQAFFKLDGYALITGRKDPRDSNSICLKSIIDDKKKAELMHPKQ
jgi:hypothetical protein